MVRQLPIRQKIQLTKELEKEAIETKLTCLLNLFEAKDLDLKTITEEAESVKELIELLETIGEEIDIKPTHPINRDTKDNFLLDLIDFS